MSEDLGIQQNVDQKRGNYSGTGFVLGAAGGAYAGTKLAQKYQIGIPTKITTDDLDKVFAQKPDFFDKKIAKDVENKDVWTKIKNYASDLRTKAEEYKTVLKELKKASPEMTEEELKNVDKLKTIFNDMKSIKNAAKEDLADGLKNVKFVHNKWINGAAAALGLGIVLAGFGSLFHKNKS